MQMRRVCIVLSAVLLAVNILFLVMYRRTRRELTTLSVSLVNDAAAFFDAEGCQVDPSVIVRAIPDDAVYAVNDTPLEQTARETAKRLSVSDSAADVTPVETPDSLICRALSGKEPCIFRLSYDAFGFSYARADDASVVSAMNDAIMPYFETDETELSSEAAGVVKRFMKHLVSRTGMSYIVSGVRSEGEITTVCVTQCCGKTPIRSCFACLVLQNGRVETASGRLLFAGAGRKYRETLVDCVNALRSLDFENVVRVLAARIVYDVRYTDSAAGYLVPVWEIRTLDRNDAENVCIIEAIGGIM